MLLEGGPRYHASHRMVAEVYEWLELTITSRVHSFYKTQPHVFINGMAMISVPGASRCTMLFSIHRFPGQGVMNPRLATSLTSLLLHRDLSCHCLVSLQTYMYTAG